MEFRKYMHIEKWGTSEVDGIEIGDCYVFPKIDGTNASVWYNTEANFIQAGSRTRQLKLDNDNAGFYQWAIDNKPLTSMVCGNKHLRFYGEFLVPHSLRTYKDNAWRRFYVFDVTEENGEEVRYLPYEEYKPLMEEYGIDYIPPICIIKNPSEERLYHQLTSNNFLIQDGKGVGEGIVIKNYGFVNRFGRTTWAKIVTSEFKEKHSKTMGAPEITDKKMVEQQITEQYVTKAMVDKVYAKIDNEGGFRSQHIPRLLNTVYYDLIREESWSFIKEHKNPTINYKTLMKFTYNKVKEHLPNIF